MILSNYLLGFIEDNAKFLTIPQFITGLSGCTEYIGYPTGICLNLLADNQPFISIPSYLLATVIGPVLTYNLIILGTLVLNFFFALKFFRKQLGKFIALLLSIVFVFSPYFAYQARSHFDLIQLWPVIWFLDILLFYSGKHKPLYSGLLLTLIIGLSNYLGYFTIIFVAVYLLFSLVFAASRLDLIKRSIKPVALSSAVFIFTSLVFIAPYIKSNFLSFRVRMEDATDIRALNRPLEDFVVFSSRPWYYLLPSIDNPFFGILSQNLLNNLTNTRNYLAQSYFKSEHTASYLGWVNLFLAVVGIWSLFTKRHKAIANPVNFYALLFTVITLVVFTMPPTVTLKGFSVYTPSFLLFKIFPMFRVLARMGILILLLILLFSGYGYASLVGVLSHRRLPYQAIQIILLILTLLSITEFYIPLKVTRVDVSPKVYEYLDQNDHMKSPIAVYPYNKTNEAVYWVRLHGYPLINPRLYENRETNFVSESFTQQLNTASGLERAKIMGAKYLIYFYTSDNISNKEFFDNSPILTLLKTFKEVGEEERKISIFGKTFLRVVEVGVAESNSAVLYKFK